MGFKLNDLTDFELRYVLNIYNYILGGSPDSKLFKNIREKIHYVIQFHHIIYHLLVYLLFKLE